MLRETLYREAEASVALDGQTFPIYPASTMVKPLDGATIRWWHPEHCLVETTGCTCDEEPKPS